MRIAVDFDFAFTPPFNLSAPSRIQIAQILTGGGPRIELGMSVLPFALRSIEITGDYYDDAALLCGGVFSSMQVRAIDQGANPQVNYSPIGSTTLTPITQETAIFNAGNQVLAEPLICSGGILIDELTFQINVMNGVVAVPRFKGRIVFVGDRIKSR